MPFAAARLSLLLELFFNGVFILIYSLMTTDQLPEKWSYFWVEKQLLWAAKFVPFVILFRAFVNFKDSLNFEDFFRRHCFSIVVIIPLVIAWGDLQFAYWLGATHLLSSILALYDDGKVKDKANPFIKQQGGRGFFQGFKLRPAQMVLLTFVGVILLGTFLLMLPVSSADGKTMSFIDGLFMATSATCVTGLSTISLSDDLSIFGQLVILMLIQIGGLSIMTLYSSVVILLGRSMQMKDRVVMQDLLDVSSLEELFAMIVGIVKYTFFIELWGGVVLTIGFLSNGFEFGQALYYGFFHSISAFCNAGFSLFNSSLESFATNPLINGTIAVLIILGGLGFIVLKELRELVVSRKSFVRLGVHSKIVIVTNFLLIGGGMLFIFFGEFLNALDGYNLWGKLQVAFFQSVTLRTAGFNTVPLTNLHLYTIYTMSLFMFIGGSPGSTAGGVKTTTLAILFQSIRSTLTGEKTVRLFDRRIPSPMVVRATALTFISILITSVFIMILMNLEPNKPFITIFFEVISASGTVGLSLGITPDLTLWGKVAIAALMLIGRIGPLTLILAIGERSLRTGKFDYPEGRIMIG